MSGKAETMPANGVKSSGQIWSEEEKDAVREQVCLGQKEGLPLTEIFRQTAKKLPHRSEAAIAMLYYNVLRKDRDTSTESKPPKKPEQIEAMPAEIVAAFEGLPEYMSKLNQRMDSIEHRLETPSGQAIVKALVEIGQQPTIVAELKQEKRALKQKIDQLQSENQQLRTKLEEMTKAHSDAVDLYDMFTNMASISQIMSLGDFKEQMKTTLDQWSQVLECTPK